MVQIRDDVTGGGLTAAECEAAVDDVTSRVSMTSRRLSDVVDRAHNVSTLAQQLVSIASR